MLSFTLTLHPEKKGICHVSPLLGRQMVLILVLVIVVS